MSKDYAHEWIDDNKSRLTSISDKIWDYAELGLQEFKSSALLIEELEKNGFSTELNVGGMPTAFAAAYGEGNPVIGILGEYDALSNLSQKAIPEKEAIIEGDPGHRCGHNIHGTSGMGAAVAIGKALKAERLNGTVKFFGCPAEETLVGKVFMVRDGVFADVDVVFSHHPGTMNSARLRSSNAMDSVKFQFYGVASHAGGSPHRGRSALDAVELMNTGVNFMREHIVQEARIHYIIEDGGGAPNVVPAYSRSWYFVRAPERAQVEHIYNWILRIAEGSSLMTGTTHDHRLLTGCYNLLSLRTMAELVVKNMREIGSPDYSDEEFSFAKAIQDTVSPEQIAEALEETKREDSDSLVGTVMDRSIPEPWGERDVMRGSTDVADVSWNTPTIEFETSTWPLGIPGHSWQIVAMGKSGVAHKSLVFAAKTMASCALDILVSDSLLENIKTEWKKSLKGRKYVSPIPSDLKPPLDQFQQKGSHINLRQ